MRHKKILFSCFGVSLFLHVSLLFCFQKYSLWFSSPQTAQAAENWLSLVDKKERDQILQSAFAPSCQDTKIEIPLEPIGEKELSFALKPKGLFDSFEEKNQILFQLSFPPEELLASPVLPTFSVPSQSFNLLEHLPKDLIIPAPLKPSVPQPLLPLPAELSLALSKTKPANTEESPINPILFNNEIDLSLTDKPGLGSAPKLISLPNLPKLPTLAELETASYSDSFDADLVFLPKGGEDKGYIFALTLIPRPDLHLPKLAQHITFLIDRSNSIQQGRLLATKAAVHKALSLLSPEDTFNIIAFDAKMEKMSPHYLPCNDKSFAAAEAFLEKVQLGSLFASSDLYKPLFLTVPGHVKQDELHTAILLTDGETLSKKAVQRALFDWTSYNQGKVSLFALGMHDHHLEKLEVATFLNRGKLFNSPTHRGMKRKLSKLLKTIQNPIAKNISCHAISKIPNAKIVLFPKTSQMPHLYLDQPYVILGETDTLDDFILFVQGKLKDRWLNIRKTISFLNAKKGNKSLKEEWAQQLAYQLYEEFGMDEDPKHLVEIKKLLEPFDIPVAF